MSITRSRGRRSGEERLRRRDPGRRDRAAAGHVLPREVERLSEGAEDPLRRLGDVGGECDRDAPQPVRELEEHPVELVRARVVLRQLPGLRLLDVPVQAAHELPDRLETSRDVEDVECGGHVLLDPLDSLDELAALARDNLQLAVAVAGDHRRRPREEVPEVVAQLALVALPERVERDVAVLAERDGPRDPEAHRIDAVLVDQLEWIDHVSERLRDRAPAEVEVAVHEQLPRHVVAGGEQERGPVDAMEAEDVLREQVPDARPQVRQVLAWTRVLERAAVVDERVRPDVRDLLRIPRDRDPPRLSGAAD